MVLPLLMMAAGQGLQAYGSDQKNQEIQNALSRMNAQNQVFNRRGNAANRQLQQLLGGLGDQYRGSQEQLVNDYSPAQRIGAYRGGETASRSGIDQVLATVNQRNPGMNTAPGAPQDATFQHAAGVEGQRVAGRTADVADAASISGGLNAMGQRDLNVSHDFSTAAGDNNMRIRDALRTYGFGDALRQKALAQADAQHSRELSDAQLAGNTQMLLGGLLSAGGQGLASYQANQGAGAADGQWGQDIPNSPDSGYTLAQYDVNNAPLGAGRTFGYAGATDLSGGAGANQGLPPYLQALAQRYSAA